MASFYFIISFGPLFLVSTWKVLDITFFYHSTYNKLKLGLTDQLAMDVDFLIKGKYKICPEELLAFTTDININIRSFKQWNYSVIHKGRRWTKVPISDRCVIFQSFHNMSTISIKTNSLERI